MSVAPLKSVTAFNPNDYNLEHFQWVHWSDAWDGKSSPMDGFDVQTLLYQGAPVYTSKKRYARGAGAGSFTEGDGRFWTLAICATNYLRFVKIMRQEMGFDMVARHTHESLMKHLVRKIFNIPLPPVGRVKDSQDTVFWLLDDEHDMLINHRQYKQFVAGAATEHGLTVTLNKVGKNDYKIKFTRQS